ALTTEPITLTALAASPVGRFDPLSIVGAVRMTLSTVGLACVLRRDGLTPHGVLAGRDCLQVCRIDAPRMSAEMVNLQAHGNRCLRQFIGETVRLELGVVSRSELSISVLAAGPTEPAPTLISTATLHESPEVVGMGLEVEHGVSHGEPLDAFANMASTVMTA